MTLTFDVRLLPPAEGKHGRREQATVTLDDGRVVASRIVSKTSCICDLCRQLVALGVPDQAWQACDPDGKIRLRGRSVHRHALLDIAEDGRAIRYARHVPMTEEDKARVRAR